MWVRCNIIVLAAAAWLESLCRRGRVVVVVDCSAVECDDWASQRPTRDLHCLMTSDEATRRPCMNVELYHGRLLHSPTHSHSHECRHLANWTKLPKYALTKTSFYIHNSTSFTWQVALLITNYNLTSIMTTLSVYYTATRETWKWQQH